MNPRTTRNAANVLDRAVLHAEMMRLSRFAEGSRHPTGGFGWLDDRGSLVADRPVEAWISCRMLHVFGIASLMVAKDSADASKLHALIAHGVQVLEGGLYDETHGGWYAAVPDNAETSSATDKRAYEHSFVILSLSTAALAGHARARGLLGAALQVVSERFWDEAAGAVVDVFNRDWSVCEPYRGANANMHMVEAFLAASDVTGDPIWRQRALRIADLFINRFARAGQWRIPEHFTSEWEALPNYNVNDPAHQFRPYGATIGHAFEWARLCLHIHGALGADAPQWLLEVSKELFANAVREGWHADGADGFLYTTDWAGKPVVRDRLHWVVCEALAAAGALHEVTGEAGYVAQFNEWWSYAEQHMIDRVNGSWIAQLDANNVPAGTVWSGKPDVYHAYQATILPRVPVRFSIASAVAKGLLQT